MKQFIIDRLNSSDYTVASHYLDELLKNNDIDHNDLKEILSLNNTLIIGDFLEKYTNFKEEDLKIVEAFININLNHSERLFVSDLIEFATTWSLSLPYDQCLRFLEKFGDDDDYVLLSSIDYIFENLRFANIEEIYRLLYSILHNVESNQSAQVKAAFILFRITNRKEFLADLIDLIVNGNENNKLLLSNILSLKYNSPLYFDYYNTLRSIIPSSLESIENMRDEQQ